MNLPSNVKLQPSWWNFPKARGRTIGTTIYLRQDIFDDLKSKKLKPESLGILVHEQTHVKRSKKIGLLKFGLLYLFSPKFRFSEELAANKEAFKILKKYNVEVDLEKKAKVLSSWKYLWAADVQTAEKELKAQWEQS